MHTYVTPSISNGVVGLANRTLLREIGETVFAQKQLSYMGHIINGDGVATLSSKI
jgi:hypothetical protein